jgi:hypothetical protein
MKTLAVCGLALFIVCGAFAQRHSGAVVNGTGTNAGFGSVVFPAGRPTQNAPLTLNGNVNRGNVVGRPGFNGTVRRNFNNGSVIYVPYAYPVYSGGYGYGYGDVPPQQQQPNFTVIYPPQQPAPVIIQGSPGQPGEVPRSMIQEYGQQPQQPPVSAYPQAAQDNQQSEANYYLLAFKDHSIYSAVGYWVDGDTLHYITTGNVHNQVSVSLVDRETTQHLNKSRGVQVTLPPSR